MMRIRLPDRRPAETLAISFADRGFVLTVGYYPDGRPGEVFTHGAAKAGSDLDGLLDDACIVLSLLLQHGLDPRTIAASMGRLGDDRPASLIGAMVDRLATLAGEAAHA